MNKSEDMQPENHNEPDATFDHQRLMDLLGLLCDELIDDDEFCELEQIMLSSRSARQIYYVYTTMAQNLESEVFDASNRNVALRAKLIEDNLPVKESESATSRTPQLAEPARQKTNWARRVAAFSTISAALLLVVVWISSSLLNKTEIAQNAAAHVLGSVNVSWVTPQAGLTVGQFLHQDRIKFNSGILHVRFARGANVAIQGPAEFEIVDEQSAFLHQGQIAVYAPPGAEGFRVNTPQAEVIDLGTEFGMSVDANGESQVHVFSGEVEYSPFGDSADKTILTAGLAVSVDGSGVSRPVELKERSFDIPRKVLWTRFRYLTSISTQFIAGNTTEIAGGVPGRIGGGWTSQWGFECDGGQIDEGLTQVVKTNPLESGLENHLDVVANSNGESFDLKIHRGFESIGDHFDCRKNYIVQFLMRINSDPEDIDQIRVADLSFDSEVSQHYWKLSADRTALPGDKSAPTLRWRELPLRTNEDTEELVVRKWKNPREIDRVKANRRVEQGRVYRVVVEVQPGNNRYRVSMSDGFVNTLVGDWTKDFKQVATGDRLERRLEWHFVAKDHVSVSFDSIRIQNEDKFKPNDSATN